MKIKLTLESQVCSDGVERPVVMFPDGDFFWQTWPIHLMLFHLAVLGMDLENGFTVETEEAGYTVTPGATYTVTGRDRTV